MAYGHLCTNPAPLPVLVTPALGLILMKLERVILSVEAIVILLPSCIVTVFFAVGGIPFILMSIGESVFLPITLPFIACVGSLVFVSRGVVGYIFQGGENLVANHWKYFISLNILVSIFVLFAFLEFLYGGTRGWEQSIAQYWPHREFLSMFSLGLPVVIPALHISYIAFRLNCTVQSGC